MLCDPRQMATNDVYRLMIGIVIPRPIAFVSTLDPVGRLNLAPFSYFVPIASRPTLVGLSFSDRAGDPKDTLRNIRDTGEYVINMVSEPLLGAMVKTAGEWPAEVSEFDVSGLTPRPSKVVRPPGVAESPVHLECRREREIALGNATFVVGEVVSIEVDDALLVEGRVDPTRLRSVGRLGGEAYSLMREVTQVPRPKVSRRPGLAGEGAIARIPVRGPEDVWTFTERNVPLWDILEHFPKDAIGSRGPKDPPRPYEVKPITVETDLGWSFETDIQFGAWVFRPRSPRQPGMMRWCRERGLAPGDSIVFERLGDRRFALRRERAAAAAPGSDEARA